LLLPGFKAEMY